MVPVSQAIHSDDTAADMLVVRQLLKLLSQRGRRIVRDGDTFRLEAVDKVSTMAGIERSAIEFMNAAGWLTAIDDQAMILSPDGRAQVRGMKSAPSPVEAGAGSSAPLPDAPRSARRQQPVSSSLAWLRARRDKFGQPMLSAPACEAAERLHADFHRAGMSPRLTVDWEAIPRTRDESRGAPGGAREQRDGTVAAGDRVRIALASVPNDLVGLVVDVCLFDLSLQAAEERVGAPQRSSHFLLRVALNELARHYGLLPRLGGSWEVPRRAQHWGASGYRPKM